MKRIYLGFLIMAVLLGGTFVIYELTKTEKPPEQATPADTIANFDECVSAGNQVTTGPPRQCTTPSGNVYIESDTNAPQSTEYVSRQGVTLTITEPPSGGIVKSPLLVTGKVPGNWSFEASFPINLVDSTGVTIATTSATLQGDWMTDAYVPFSATLVFDTPVGGGNGNLIIIKANPSDLPENADRLLIPVAF